MNRRNSWLPYIKTMEQHNSAKMYVGEFRHECPEGDPPDGYALMLLPENKPLKERDYFLVCKIEKLVPENDNPNNDTNAWSKHISLLGEKDKIFVGEFRHECPAENPPNGYALVLLPDNVPLKERDYFLVRQTAQMIPDPRD